MNKRSLLTDNISSVIAAALRQPDASNVASDSTPGTEADKQDLPLERDIERTLAMFAEGFHDSFFNMGAPGKGYEVENPRARKNEPRGRYYGSISSQVMAYMLDKGWLRQEQVCAKLTGAGMKAAAEYVSKTGAQDLPEPDLPPQSRPSRPRKRNRPDHH